MYTFIVFCAGASASGKTTFSKMLEEALNQAGVATKLISMDNYYKARSKDDSEATNFDEPDAFDLNLLRQQVRNIHAQLPIEQPQFCFKIKNRLKETIYFNPKDTKVVIVEGIHGLYNINSYKLPAEHKYTVYVETDRYLDYLQRRIIRDEPPSSEGGRSTPPEVTRQRELKSGVRDAFFMHIAPVKNCADYKISNNHPDDLKIALKEVTNEILIKLKSSIIKQKHSVKELISIYENLAKVNKKQALESIQPDYSVANFRSNCGS